MLNEKYFFPFLMLEAEKDKGGETTKEDTTEKETETGKNIETLEDAKGALEAARKEAAKYRTRSKEYEETKKRLEKLESGLKGIFGEGEELDPEKLKSKTQSLESELKTERVKNAVTIQAINEGLDPDLTIAHLHLKGKLKDLDPSDAESISEVVSKASEEKPNLKTSKPDKVGSGGNDDGVDGKNKLNPIDEYRRKRGILPSYSK